jgi:glycerol-3-phosphate dehydrogenase
LTFPDTEFDLIIIGAGINGAGVARDAAIRGLKVLLLDKGDFGGGTSSWSTRLIHGGLRYLEHGELGLVRESLREREILLNIAPHLIKPLSILVPIYANRRRGSYTIRAGMISYDLLSFDKTLPNHKWISREQTLQYAPGLKAEGLRSGAIFYDAQVEFAERLVLENVLAAHENSAKVKTYVKVTDFLIRDRRVCGVRYTDEFTGECAQAESRLTVNASGPWVDDVLKCSALSSSPLVGGTKGSHLILGPFPGAHDSAVYVEAERDHRPIFIIPWNGYYLIGTTDIRYEGPLDQVEIDDSEVSYLLSEVNALFPAAQLTRDSILFTYSGVRPLAFARNKHEQEITRRHFVHEHSEVSGLISLIGGKLTTYRSLAKQTVDLCFERLGRTSVSCETGTNPLPGAEASSNSGDIFGGLSSRTSDRLQKIYGSRSRKLLTLVREHPELLDSFDPESGAIGAEVVFAFQSELAKTLSDCLMRRSMVGLNSTCGLNCVEGAAKIAQKYLGWSVDRARLETDNYRRYVQRFLLK